MMHASAIPDPASGASEHRGSEAQGPVLLCFDGSDSAINAIARARSLLAERAAVVVTVWEPVASWEPYDPGAIVSAGLSKLGSEALGLDEIAEDLARAKAEQGLAHARAQGFEAEVRIVSGKPWRAICDLAEELRAASIVLGARGLSRVQSVLLGSVSAAVVAHAHRPVLLVRDDAAIDRQA